MRIGKTGSMGLGLAIALLGVCGALIAGAQGPGDGPGGMGMGPHRPPMERAMGPRGEHGHEFGRWWNEPHAIEKFKFTDAQRKSMDDIYMKHRLSIVDLHATLEKAELGMEPLMGADQPEEGKILAQIDSIAAARAELEKANARMLFELRRQLTPDQWKMIKADRAAHGDGQGPEGRGDGRDGANSRSHRQWQRGPGQGKQGPGSDSGPAPNGTPGAGTPPPPPGEEE